MKKGINAVFAAAIIFVILLVSAYCQEDMTAVDNSVFDNPQRVPALFKHDEHNEAAGLEDCSECHHVYEDGSKVEDASSEDQRCSDCHGKKDMGNQFALTKAFHKNCKGCHMEQSKGPIMCGECHLR